MASTSEDEIYSIMFSSFKHPIRRKILRILDSKSMTFMELVEALGISTPSLTYHLESLGELISKLDNGTYKLSAFGHASISALKGVEDVHSIEPKRRWFALNSRTVFAALLIVIVLLSSFSVIQLNKNDQLLESQQILHAENQQLKSWGMGTDKVANFLYNVTHINTRNYIISLLSNDLYWRTDFVVGIPEETATYSLTSSNSNLIVQFRFRNNHFSRYELTMIESSPIFTQNVPNSLLLNAHWILSSYQTYSGDEYIVDMLNLLSQISSTQSITVTEGNMKLEVSLSGATAELSWLYTENGIDYKAKSLQMIFQNNVLVTMTDNYFLYQKASSIISITKERAIEIAENYVKTMTYPIEGEQVSGFQTISPPTVQMLPNVRGGSVELYPYWYIELKLDRIYPGGLNIVGIGIYADTGQIGDVRLQRGNIDIY